MRLSLAISVQAEQIMCLGGFQKVDSRYVQTSLSCRIFESAETIPISRLKRVPIRAILRLLLCLSSTSNQFGHDLAVIFAELRKEVVPAHPSVSKLKDYLASTIHKHDLELQWQPFGYNAMSGAISASSFADTIASKRPDILPFCFDQFLQVYKT